MADLYKGNFMWSAQALYQWARDGSGWQQIPYRLHNNKVFAGNSTDQRDWTGFWFHYDQNGRIVVTEHAWTGTDLRPAAQRPAARPQPAAQRPVAPAQRPVQRPAARPQPAQRGWVAAGSPPHAFRGSVDLGLLVNSSQVVQPTNGGRLWALYNLKPDGSLEFVNRYGSVPGAPPPPNAVQNRVPAQFYPPPPPAPVAQPMYQDPYAAAAPMYDPSMYAPAYAAAPMFAMPAYDPSMYSIPEVPTGTYAMPADAYAAPGYGYVPGYYDPSAYAQPQQMDPATAAYLGAQAGIQQAVAELGGDTGSVDMGGGGYVDAGAGADTGGGGDAYASLYGDAGMLSPDFSY